VSARREFIAIVPAPELQRAIADAFGPAIPRGARAPHPEDLHVTLYFLGSVERDVEGLLDRDLAALAARHAAPDLTIRGAGSFPARGRERVLWIGVEDRGGRLARLQADVSRACAALGFPPEERAWSPHLTLARIDRGRRPPARVPEAFYGVDFSVGWKPSAVARVLSLPAGGPGARYAVDATYPLACA
jgi:2'-5' RNA ligase